MAEQILSAEYWRRRLRKAEEIHHLHQAVFKCPADRWQRIEAKHREILSRLIEPTDSILDAGCGWGRLLTLLPQQWEGRYLGIDLSDCFVDLATKNHPTKEFIRASLHDYLPHIKPIEYDWAVLISIRPMIKREVGSEYWQQIDKLLHKAAKKVLFLEYDETDEGSVE